MELSPRSSSLRLTLIACPPAMSNPQPRRFPPQRRGFSCALQVTAAGGRVRRAGATAWSAHVRPAKHPVRRQRLHLVGGLLLPRLDLHAELLRHVGLAPARVDDRVAGIATAGHAQFHQPKISIAAE